MSVLKGGERTLHKWSIISRQFGVWILAGLIGGAGAWGIGMKLTSTTTQWHAAQSVFFSMGQEKHRALVGLEWRAWKSNAQRAGDLGAGGAFGMLLLVWYVFDKFGNAAKDKKHKRGSRLVNSEQLSRMVRRRARDEPDIELCGVPLPPGSERKHILMIGTTGVGKSTCMRELLDQVRGKGERAIVFDPGGHFLTHLCHREPRNRSNCIV